MAASGTAPDGATGMVNGMPMAWVHAGYWRPSATFGSVDRESQSRGWGSPSPEHSHPAEPIVAAVFPKSTGEAVGHEHRRDPFRILEAELGRDAKLEGIAVARCQNLVGNLEREKRLRVQCRRHVDAGVISVGAFEADVF